MERTALYDSARTGNCFVAATYHIKQCASSRQRNGSGTEAVNTHDALRFDFVTVNERNVNKTKNERERVNVSLATGTKETPSPEVGLHVNYTSFLPIFNQNWNVTNFSKLFSISLYFMKICSVIFYLKHPERLTDNIGRNKEVRFCNSPKNLFRSCRGGGSRYKGQETPWAFQQQPYEKHSLGLSNKLSVPVDIQWEKQNAEDIQFKGTWGGAVAKALASHCPTQPNSGYESYSGGWDHLTVACAHKIYVR
jgi:hypothetical protein